MYTICVFVPVNQLHNVYWETSKQNGSEISHSKEVLHDKKEVQVNSKRDSSTETISDTQDNLTKLLRNWKLSYVVY